MGFKRPGVRVSPLRPSKRKASCLPFCIKGGNLLLKKIIMFFARSQERRHFLRFCCVGTSSFCAEYIIFTILNTVIGNKLYSLGGIQITGLLIANSVSYMIAFWYCFTLNRKWTFRSSGSVVRQLRLYAVLFTVNLIISNVLIHFLGWLGITPQIGKIIVALIIAMWNFFAYRIIFSLE